MPKSKKCKTDGGGGLDVPQKRPPVICMLHVIGIQHGEFTSMKNIKGSPSDMLNKLHGIRDRRLLESHDSPNRMTDICKGIPENLDGKDLGSIGYHRGCYQNFTNNLSRLKCRDTSKSSGDASKSRSPRKPSTSSGIQFFPPACIFCKKIAIKVSRKTERCSKFSIFKDKDGSFKVPTWKKIEHRALELGDNRLHRMVQGEDLFAKEAQFHQTCLKAFNLKYLKHCKKQGTNNSQGADQDQKATAYEQSFSTVLEFLQEQVIEQKEVVQLSSLRLLFIKELEKNGFPNPEYRGEKLKARLENHPINENISMIKFNPGDKGCITYHLVYSSSLSVADAVAYAFKLGSRDNYHDVAVNLHRIILKSFNDSESLPWPPTADDLEVKSPDEFLPPELVMFLKCVIGGEADIDRSEKKSRIVFSIGQV